MEETQEQSIALQVSAILVGHNQAAALRRAIEALERSADRERLEILVVDCGSQDESARLDEDYPGITIMRLPHHFGATKAMNVATRTAKGEYLFYLSPDVEVAPDTVKRLAAHLDEETDVTAACPLLVDPEGRPVSKVWKIPTREMLAAFCRGEEPPSEPIDTSAEHIAVEYPGLTALLIRKQFIGSMNYFDGRYGHYWADADLAMQMRRAQKRIRLYPGIRAVWHQVGDPWAGVPAFAADRVLGAAAFLGRYQGFGASLSFRLSAILSALVHFRFGEFGALVSGQKVDGN